MESCFNLTEVSQQGCLNLCLGKRRLQVWSASGSCVCVFTHGFYQLCLGCAVSVLRPCRDEKSKLVCWSNWPKTNCFLSLQGHGGYLHQNLLPTVTVPISLKVWVSGQGWGQDYSVCARPFTNPTERMSNQFYLPKQCATEEKRKFPCSSVSLVKRRKLQILSAFFAVHWIKDFCLCSRQLQKSITTEQPDLVCLLLASTKGHKQTTENWRGAENEWCRSTPNIRRHFTQNNWQEKLERPSVTIRRCLMAK